MNFSERQKKIIQFLRVYGALTNHDVQSLTNSHRNTATNDLKKLVEEGLLSSSGTGKGTVYRLEDDTIFSNSAVIEIFPKKEKGALDRYFKKNERQKVFFNKVSELALNANFSFSKHTLKQFELMQIKINQRKMALTSEERKRRKEQLVIDLSWASSNIEGNTYSLLETEGLLKYNQTAKGKHFQEAQMILNHKDAIDYIRQGNHYQTLGKQKILELHQILIKNLGVETGLREHLVSISNSSFIPCDNKFQIASFLDLIVEKINDAKSVLEKVVMSNLLMIFLQPFSDGNKRTSRMLGNALLLSYDFVPISFLSTPKEDYIKAILYFYERQNPEYFKQLLLLELNNSFRKYVA